MPAEAQPECPECDGTGVVKEQTRECYNCKGQGSCQAGANSFVCQVCDGEGEQRFEKEVNCTACQGTGAAPRPSPQPVGRRGEAARGEDVLRIASAPQAKAKVKAKAKAGAKAAVQAGGGPQAPKAVAPVAGRRGSEPDEEAGGEHGDAGDAAAASGCWPSGAIRWEPGAGLVVGLTLPGDCLLNTAGLLLVLVSFMCFAGNHIVLTAVGVLVLIAGLAFIVRGNAERLAPLWESLSQLSAKPSEAGRAT